MKKFYAVALAALLASPVFADESFGGLGVTILPAREGGVRILEVIPGTPAEAAGFEANDRIIAVDRVAFGKDFEAAKDALRGTVGKPLEVTYVREADTLSVVLRRGHIRLKDVSKESLESWYGENVESYSEEEMKVVAENGKSENQKLVAVLEHGLAIKDKSNGEDVKAIFVETEPVFEKKFDKSKKNQHVKGSARLKGLSRTTVSFNAVAGDVRIVITDVNGKVVENKLVAANGGANFVPWNGENVPAGRYSVTLEQNGVYTKIVKIK